MDAYRKIILYGILCLVWAAVVPGCTWFKGGGATKDLQEFANESGPGVFYRQAELPPAVQEWVENAARNLYLGQSRVFGDYRYILVTYGPKPTGGYAVQVTGVIAGPHAITVAVKFKDPLPGEIVTEAFTYPYDLVLIPAVNLPVEFAGHGAQEHVMALYGIDSLAPIVAASAWIKVFEPAPGAAVTGIVRVSGVASVFEGLISYRIVRNGAVLAADQIMAGMGDWYYFEEEIPLAAIVPGITSPLACVLELFTISPRDGTEAEKVSIPVTLKP